MSKPSVELGRIVQSMAGRDKGRAFVVVGWADGAHALIADGRLRRVDAPKRKKVIHLRAKPECLSSILEKLMMGQRVQDSEIRTCLAQAGYGPGEAASGQRDEEAYTQCPNRM